MSNTNGSHWIYPLTRQRIYERDNWRCGYCGKYLRNVAPRYRTLDHVVPVHASEKPDNRSTNLITACKRCNDRKNGTPLATFLKNDFDKIDKIIAQLEKPLCQTYNPTE
jgi:5-methylcytosine-specific restriction endonuclease McrA